MLWVYASIDVLKAIELARQDLPTSNMIDLSKCLSDDLATAVEEYCNHHADGHIFLGYLDPLLMLHPVDEARLRRGFTQCTMSLVVSNPRILPLSWKNGIERLRILDQTIQHAPHSKVVHHGSAAYVQDEGEHGLLAAQASHHGDAHQG